jgi:hypothetical protein
MCVPSGHESMPDPTVIRAASPPISFFVALALAGALLFSGCLPPLASVLLSEEERADQPDYAEYAEVGGNDYYSVIQYYTPDSLRARLQHDVGRVKVELLNGDDFKVRRARFVGDSLRYVEDGRSQALAMSAVRSLVLYESRSTRKILRDAGIGALLFAGAANAPASSRSSTTEAAKSAGIGALIGAPVGMWLSLRARDRETVLINGYTSQGCGC